MKKIYTEDGESRVTDIRVIDVSQGICPLGPSNKVKAAIRKAVKDVKYGPDAALARLERLFTSKFGVPDYRILFANSVRELVCAAAMTLRPKRVLIVGPATRLYEEAASKAGAEVIYSDYHEDSGFAADAGGIIKKLDGVDLVYIANPNRVTGRLIEGSVLSLIEESAAEKKTTVVVDESLMDFVVRGETGSEVFSGESIITIRTTAHFYGLPGCELAYAVSDHSAVRSLRMKKDCSLSLLSAEAARTALKDEAYRKLTRRFIADEKKLLARELGKVDGVTYFDSDTNVYLVKLDRPGQRLLDSFLKAGLLVRDCSDISGTGNSFLRLSVMSHDRNLKLIRLFKTLVPSGLSLPPVKLC